MSFVCVTCDQKFDTVPDDAVQITPDQRRIISYRFINGTTRHLRHDATRGNAANCLHTRWHQNKKKPECIYCYPPPEPEPPVEHAELLTEVIDVLTELPEPQPEIPLEPIAELEPNTAIATAFRRLFK